MDKIPVFYNAFIAEAFCQEVAKGLPLRECAKNVGASLHTVMNWIRQFPDFEKHYTEAKAIACTLMFEEILEIADNASNDWMMRNDPDNPGFVQNGEHTQRSRLRIDTRKFYLAKIMPKKYGDRIAVEHEISDSTAERILAARKRVKAGDGK